MSCTHAFVIQFYCIYTFTTHNPQNEYHRLKEAGQKLYTKEEGEEWARRPLHPMLIEYAASDVRHLLGMKAFWGDEKVDEEFAF